MIRNLILITSASISGCDCGGAEVLKIIKFIFILLDLVMFIIPMGLIIMTSLDLGKNVIAGKEDEMKKNLNITIKRIIFCVVLFLIPTIVQFAINLLGDLGVDYAKCITIATEEELSTYESCDLFGTPTTSDSNTNNNTSTNTSNEDTTTNNSCNQEIYFSNCYQPRSVNGVKLKKTGFYIKDVSEIIAAHSWISINDHETAEKKKNQNIWQRPDEEDYTNYKYYIWHDNGNKGGEYVDVTAEMQKFYGGDY